MKKKKDCLLLISLFFGLLFSLTFSKNTFRQKAIASEINNSVDDQTSSPTPSPEKDESIENLREEIKKKVEEKLKNIIQGEEKRGWIGIISEKNENELTLLSNDLKRTIIIDEETTIIDEKRKEIKATDLKIEQKIIALGYLKDEKTLKAKRIVAVPKGTPRKITAIFGVISDKSKENQVLLIAPVKAEEKESELIITDKTVIFQISSGKIQKRKYDDIKVDQKIVAIIEPTKENGGTYNAKKILLLTTPQTSFSPTPKENQ